jgi:hypothetical protein
MFQVPRNEQEAHRVIEGAIVWATRPAARAGSARVGTPPAAASAPRYLSQLCLAVRKVASVSEAAVAVEPPAGSC